MPMPPVTNVVSVPLLCFIGGTLRREAQTERMSSDAAAAAADAATEATARVVSVPLLRLP